MITDAILPGTSLGRNYAIEDIQGVLLNEQRLKIKDMEIPLARSFQMTINDHFLESPPGALHFFLVGPNRDASTYEWRNDGWYLLQLPPTLLPAHRSLRLVDRFVDEDVDLEFWSDGRIRDLSRHAFSWSGETRWYHLGDPIRKEVTTAGLFSNHTTAYRLLGDTTVYCISRYGSPRVYTFSLEERIWRLYANFFCESEPHQALGKWRYKKLPTHVKHKTCRFKAGEVELDVERDTKDLRVRVGDRLYSSHDLIDDTTSSGIRVVRPRQSNAVTVIGQGEASPVFYEPRLIPASKFGAVWCQVTPMFKIFPPPLGPLTPKELGERSHLHLRRYTKLALPSMQNDPSCCRQSKYPKTT